MLEVLLEGYYLNDSIITSSPKKINQKIPNSMEYSNNNRGARGRIAEVLAEARASLKEPTRPFTPASLDARTSIDLKALDKFGRIAMTKNPSYGRLPDDYYPSSSSSRTQSFEDLDNNNPVLMKSKRRANRKENPVNSFSAPPSLSSIAGEVMLAIFKLKETLAPQDDFMADDEDAAVGGGLKLYNSASLQEICLRSAEPIEKIAKYLVGKNEDEGMGNDIVDVAFDYARTVIDRGIEREECAVTRDLASRLVLRLFTSLLSKIDSINSSSTKDNKGSFLSSTRYQPLNIVGVLLQIIKTMYRIHTEVPLVTH